MSRPRSCSRLISVVLAGVMVAGPVFAAETPPEQPQPVPPAEAAEAPAAADTSSLWFPWQGILIGGAVGGVGGYFLTKARCSPGDFFPCDSAATISAISMGGLGALVGFIFQGLFFGPGRVPEPARPLGAISFSVLPGITLGETTSLSLTVNF